MAEIYTDQAAIAARWRASKTTRKFRPKHRDRTNQKHLTNICLSISWRYSVGELDVVHLQCQLSSLNFLCPRLKCLAYEQLKPRAPLLRPPLWQLEIDETSALSCWLAIAQQWLPWGYLSVLSFASEVPK